MMIQGYRLNTFHSGRNQRRSPDHPARRYTTPDILRQQRNPFKQKQPSLLCNAQGCYGVFPKHLRRGGIAGFSPLRRLVNKPPPGVLIPLSATETKKPRGYPWCMVFQSLWRRGGDSNPRYLAVHLISSQARSTTLTPLQLVNCKT